MKMALSRALVAVVLLAAIAPAVGEASATRMFGVRAQKDWLEGEAQGLRISPRGEVTLAPAAIRAAVIDETIVWAVAPASDGGAWVGTGSGGRLLRVSAAGELVVEAVFAEHQVTALLADGDSVLAATSPNGALYRVRPGQAPEELGRPKAQYLWALARGSDGAVYAASGIEGIIWRIFDGKAEEWYRAPDLHVVSLLDGGDGTLLAGTAERGLVLRVSGPNRATVVYDSGLKEVKALLRTRDGSVYAAINGGASYRDGASVPRSGEATVTVSAGGPAEADGAQAGQQAMALPLPETLGEQSAEIVRISPGEITTVARTRGEICYALAEIGNGEVLAGTARRMLVAQGNEDPAAIELSEGGQVSSIVPNSSGLLVGTTAPSRLWQMSVGNGREGYWLSKVFAADGDAVWGTLRWDAELPKGTALTFETRSGGSAETDSTWSEWSAAQSIPGPIASPGARFVQVRMILRSDGPGGPAAGAPAVVRGLTLAYLMRNLAPVVKSFKAEPPGVVYPKAAQGQNVVELAPPPLPSMFEELGPPRADPSGGGKRLYRRGAQTLTWELSDANDDELHVKLFVRPRDGGAELLLRDRPDSSPFTFDTEALPDGWWLARIEATDEVANPAPAARVGSRESETFLVDNSAPRLVIAEHSAGRKRITAEIRASDALSGLWKAEWSVNGGPFNVLAPKDGITDSLEEIYLLDVEVTGAQPHLAVVRVTDLAGMSATISVTGARAERGAAAGGGDASAGDPGRR